MFIVRNLPRIWWNCVHGRDFSRFTSTRLAKRASITKSLIPSPHARTGTAIPGIDRAAVFIAVISSSITPSNSCRPC